MWYTGGHLGCWFSQYVSYIIFWKLNKTFLSDIRKTNCCFIYFISPILLWAPWKNITYIIIYRAITSPTRKNATALMYNIYLLNNFYKINLPTIVGNLGKIERAWYLTWLYFDIIWQRQISIFGGICTYFFLHNSQSFEEYFGYFVRQEARH